MEVPQGWGGAGEMFSFQRDMVAVAMAGGDGLGIWGGGVDGMGRGFPSFRKGGIICQIGRAHV